MFLSFHHNIYRALPLQLSVSLDRINRYLVEEELDPSSVEHNPLSQTAIEIIDGTFSWDQDSSPVLSE